MKIKNCYFCENVVQLKELVQVDNDLNDMDEEVQEFILDQLPESDKEQKVQYIHQARSKRNVLNICLKCFNTAFKKVMEFDD